MKIANISEKKNITFGDLVKGDAYRLFDANMEEWICIKLNDNYGGYSPANSLRFKLDSKECLDNVSVHKTSKVTPINLTVEF